MATWEVMGSLGIRVPKYQSGLLANGEKGERRKVIFHCVIIKWKFIKMNSKSTYDTLDLKGEIIQVQASTW